MSKKKRSKDEFVNFVRALFSHKRADRRIKIPVDYLNAVADQIWRSNPSKQIIYNTLVDVFTVAHEKGWVHKEESSAWFKLKQQKHIEEEFNQFKDAIDDEIHNTNQPK